jgi:hypothetical protein
MLVAAIVLHVSVPMLPQYGEDESCQSQELKNGSSKM